MCSSDLAGDDGDFTLARAAAGRRKRWQEEEFSFVPIYDLTSARMMATLGMRCAGLLTQAEDLRARAGRRSAAPGNNGNRRELELRIVGERRLSDERGRRGRPEQPGTCRI